ncbi:MAG: hypothetical protein WC291_10565, partial [Thermodesulfovibrionales bacterium]
GELSQPGELLIFSDSYQIASELAFYLEGQPRTYCINLGRRMNQYDLWPDMNSAVGAAKGIFVRDGDAVLPEEVRDAFGRCEKRVVQINDKGRRLREYSLFICYNFRGLKARRPATY